MQWDPGEPMPGCFGAKAAARKACSRKPYDSAMDAAKDDLRCGLCGQVMDAEHEQNHDESGMSAGRRVEYVVVALRGAIAHCQVADDPSRTSKTGADLLAKQLGIDLPDLLGRRYTCWETPTEYGVIRNGFEPA